MRWEHRRQRRPALAIKPGPCPGTRVGLAAPASPGRLGHPMAPSNSCLCQTHRHLPTRQEPPCL